MYLVLVDLTVTGNNCDINNSTVVNTSAKLALDDFASNFEEEFVNRLINHSEKELLENKCYRVWGKCEVVLVNDQPEFVWLHQCVRELC